MDNLERVDSQRPASQRANTDRVNLDRADSQRANTDRVNLNRADTDRTTSDQDNSQRVWGTVSLFPSGFGIHELIAEPIVFTEPEELIRQLAAPVFQNLRDKG